MMAMPMKVNKLVPMPVRLRIMQMALTILQVPNPGTRKKQTPPARPIRLHLNSTHQREAPALTTEWSKTGNHMRIHLKKRPAA